MTIAARSIKSFMLATAFLTTTIPGLISCSEMSRFVKKNVTIHTRVPVQIFTRVYTIQKINPLGCGKKNKPELLEKCKKFIKDLPAIKNSGIGSGGIINSAAGPVILTAAHVCVNPEIKETFHKGYHILLKSETEISVAFFNQGHKLKAKIIKIDNKRDLCILYCKDIPYSGVNIAPDPPRHGDKIVTIGAPLGVTGKNLSLIYSGYYSGILNNRHYYTVPTRPGSSGSLVLNNKFQVIGMLNIALTNLENLGIGVGHKEIKEFSDSLK